jgi:hypothetical protein
MKTIALSFLLALAAASAFAQPAPALPYPTKIESLLRRIGEVVNSSSDDVGTVDGTLGHSQTNILTLVVRWQAVVDAYTREKEYGLDLQMGHSHAWGAQHTYVDYDELNRLVAGIDKLMLLKPELPVVQSRYETRGGLIVATYSTEKREILGRIQLSNDQTFWLQITPQTLKDFHDLLITAKNNLDTLKSQK